MASSATHEKVGTFLRKNLSTPVWEKLRCQNRMILLQAAWFRGSSPTDFVVLVDYASERMTLRTTLLHLLAFAAVASALLPTARPYTTPIRAFRAGQPLLAEPAAQAQGVDECIVEAENALELSACADTSTPSSAPTASAGTAESGVAISEESKRSALMGAAESLQECLSEAEGGAEVEECEMDYDELVSGPGN